MKRALSFIRKEKFVERIVLSKLFWSFFILFLFSYPVYRSLNRELPENLPRLFRLETVGFLDQFSELLAVNDLSGKVSIWHFFSSPEDFNNFFEIQKIQKRVAGLGDSVAILSIYIGKEEFDHRQFYLDKKGIPHIWRILTWKGPLDFDHPFFKRFKNPAPEMDNSQLDKSLFFLVDKKLNVRSFYENEREKVDQMMIDIGLLANDIFK
jgi:protein SCO1